MASVRFVALGNVVEYEAGAVDQGHGVTGAGGS